MTDYNLDQAINDIQAGGEIGASPDASMTPSGQINQPSFDPNLQVTYPANGREISEPLSMVMKRASMGYNYAQLMQQHKQREEQLTAREQQIAESAKKWQQYDEYATQNPQWADHVRAQWEQRFSFGQQGQNQASFDSQQQASTANLPPEMAREIAELRSFAQQYRAEQQARMQAEQDAELAGVISTVQNEFPDIDLRATDPMTGENLEQQVLRHAQTYGINSFRAAFRDMMFDKLLARGQTQAKETVAKQMQQQVKQGFLGKSDSPFGAQQQSVNVKNHSYHSLMDVAAKELGLM